MAPEHMRDMEQSWPAVRAGMENGKHRLEVAIQVEGLTKAVRFLDALVIREKRVAAWWV